MEPDVCVSVKLLSLYLFSTPMINNGQLWPSAEWNWSGMYSLICRGICLGGSSPPIGRICQNWRCIFNEDGEGRHGSLRGEGPCNFWCLLSICSPEDSIQRRRRPCYCGQKIKRSLIIRVYDRYRSLFRTLLSQVDWFSTIGVMTCQRIWFVWLKCRGCEASTWTHGYIWPMHLCSYLLFEAELI